MAAPQQPPTVSFGAWLRDEIDLFISERKPTDDLIHQVNQRHFIKLVQVEYGDNRLSEDEICAYIASVFPNNTRAAKSVLNWKCNPHLPDYLHAKALQVGRKSASRGTADLCVSSFGCGPASECLAFLNYLQRRQLDLYVHFQLFDLNDWSDAAGYFLTKYATANQARFTSSFAVMDVLTPDFISAMGEKVKNVDVFILSKFACQIHTHKRKDEFYAALFQAAKPDSIFLIIDRVFKYEQRSDVMLSVESAAYRCGFRVTASSLDADNDCEEVDPYKGKVCTFRLLQKETITSPAVISKRRISSGNGRITIIPKQEAILKSTPVTSSFMPDFMVGNGVERCNKT